MSAVAPGWRHIVGHDWAVHLLSHAVRSGRVGHAYLLTGPDRIGKTTLARTFAQALNCVAELPERPCGACRSCQLIAADRHPDVRLIEPEVSDRGTPAIKIEQIRRLLQDLSLSTYESSYKIAILKRFDTANLNAANAFLKTLEEPPAGVVLILTAPEVDTLLPTIASRCRTIGLRPTPQPLIEETLMRRRVPADAAHLLSHVADGRMGWAVQAAQDQTLMQARDRQLSTLHEAIGGGRVARFELADKLARKPETLPDLLRTWLSWWRDVTLLAFNPQGLSIISNLDEQESLYRAARAWPRRKTADSLRQTNEAIRHLGRNANARLVLENLFLTYPQSQDLPATRT